MGKTLLNHAQQRAFQSTMLLTVRKCCGTPYKHRATLCRLYADCRSYRQRWQLALLMHNGLTKRATHAVRKAIGSTLRNNPDGIATSTLGVTKLHRCSAPARQASHASHQTDSFVSMVRSSSTNGILKALDSQISAGAMDQHAVRLHTSTLLAERKLDALVQFYRAIGRTMADAKNRMEPDFDRQTYFYDLRPTRGTFFEVIRSLGTVGRTGDACELFTIMVRADLDPDVHTLMALLRCPCDRASYTKLVETLQSLQNAKRGRSWPMDTSLANRWLAGLCRSGMWNEAADFINGSLLRLDWSKPAQYRAQTRRSSAQTTQPQLRPRTDSVLPAAPEMYTKLLNHAIRAKVPTSRPPGRKPSSARSGAALSPSYQQSDDAFPPTPLPVVVALQCIQQAVARTPSQDPGLLSLQTQLSRKLAGVIQDILQRKIKSVPLPPARTSAGAMTARVGQGHGPVAAAGTVGRGRGEGGSDDLGLVFDNSRLTEAMKLIDEVAVARVLPRHVTEEVSH